MQALRWPGVTTDQRGVPRPYGSAPDIGAYEWNGAPLYHKYFSLGAITRSNGQWSVGGLGPTNMSFHLQASSNLVNWQSISTNNSGPFGSYSIPDNSTPTPRARFYRTASP